MYHGGYRNGSGGGGGGGGRGHRQPNPGAGAAQNYGSFATTENTVQHAFGIHTPGMESTVADFCLESNFISAPPEPANLLVASNNVLRVYRLGTPNGEASTERLEVLATFTLHGGIQSMEAVRLSNAPRDSLFITFLDAKLSVVEYDPETHDLKTVSMHAFEDSDTRDGKVQRVGFPEVKIDPAGRCAIMMVYNTKFVVLPLAKESAQEAAGSDPKADTASRFRSYVINCQHLDPPIKNILDFQLLDGFYEPTLVVLYEPVPGWAGRYAMTRDTKAIAALSLNIYEQKNPAIWSVGDLPSDALRLIAVPRPLGGVLVVGANCLAYLNQATPPHAVSLNGYADKHSAFNLRKQEDATLALDGSHHVMLTSNKIVFSLKGGELYLLTLVTDGRALERFTFHRLATSVLTQCICKMGTQYLFLGSRLGNSMLLRFREVTAEAAAAITAADEDDRQASKKARVDPAAASTALYGEDDDALLDVQTTFKLEKVDSLLNTGPISTCVASCFDQDRKADPTAYQMIATSGFGRNGALSVMQKSVQPYTIMSTNQLSVDQRCIDLWTVHAIPAAKHSARDSERESYSDSHSDSDSRSDSDSDREDEGEAAATASADAAGHHSYLALSKGGSTVVFRTTNGDLDQISESSGLTIESPSIYVGNLCENKFIVQVCPQGIQLIKNETQVQHIPSGADSDIVAASVCDPYIAVRFRDGSVMVLKINADRTQLDMVMRREASGDPVEALSLFQDRSGMFDYADQIGSKMSATTPAAATSAAGAVASAAAPATEETAPDDIDDLLYGGSEDEDEDEASGASTAVPAAAEASGDTTVPDAVTETVWCVLTSQSGLLEICELPDMTVRFSFNNFMYIPRLLKDVGKDMAEVAAAMPAEVDELYDVDEENDDGTMPSGEPARATSNGAPPSSARKEPRDLQDGDPRVTEIMLVGLASGKRPHLFCTLDSGHVAMYEIFPYHHPGPITPKFMGRLKMRMKKMQHPIFLRDAQLFQKTRRDSILPELDHLLPSEEPEMEDGQEEVGEEQVAVADFARPILRHFTDVNGMDGVFVCSSRPYWIMTGKRQTVRIHPMWNARTEAFAPFNSVHCQRGFVSLCDGDLRMAMLPTHFNYDSEMPVCKMPLKKTASMIVHHEEEDVYAMITCTMRPSLYTPVKLEDRSFANEPPTKEGGESVAAERDPRMLPSIETVYSVEMVSPANWMTIPNTTIALKQYEVVTSCATVKLNSEEHISGKKEYIILGTTFVCSEDVSTRGRILILDVLDVVPEPGLPLTKNKFKELCTEPQKGAVSALSSINGYLLIATGEKSGAKIYVHKFINKEKLEAIAFADAMVFVTSISTIKSLVLCGDLYQGMSFFRFSEEPQKTRGRVDPKNIKMESQLTRIGKDPHAHPIGSNAVDFFVHEDYLGFVSCDSIGNLVLYSYTPDDPQTEGGRRLERRGDFHVGAHITTMFRIGTAQTMISNDQIAAPDTRHALVYGTKEGSIGMVLPIQETLYRRLHMLQNKMNMGLQHRAGLNPKAYRMAVTQRKRRFNIKRNILDGGLLSEFLTLGVIEQREFAKRIGTPVEDILNDLCDLAVALTVT